jgi:hypothetical protein
MPSSKSFDDNCQSDASRATAASRRYLQPLTIDEKRTYQKWKRAMFIVYGAVAVIIATLSIVTGPTDKDPSGTGEMYSSLAPAAGKSR